MFKKPFGNNIHVARSSTPNHQRIEERLETNECEYHRGLLSFDRVYDIDLHNRAKKILKKAQNNEIYCLQRRLFENVYSYFYVIKQDK